AKRRRRSQNDSRITGPRGRRVMTALDRGTSIGPARRRRFQLGVGKLLFLVACTAAMLGAWRFRRENSDVERGFLSPEAPALAWGNDPGQRVWAAHSLANVRTHHVGVAVGALCDALSDRDSKVRQAAASSLGTAIHRGIAASEPGIAAQMDAATAALLEALK